MTASPLDALAGGKDSGGRSNTLGGLRLRLLTPGDELLLQRGFATLSPASRHLRYGLPLRDAHRALQWVRLLGDGTHTALGACADGHPVGVARYVRESDTAEAAVTIVDVWQGRGAGTFLLEALCAHARHAGVCAFRASVLAENRRALRLLGRFGAERSRREGAWLVYELFLASPQTSQCLTRSQCLPEHQRATP